MRLLTAARRTILALLLAGACSPALAAPISTYPAASTLGGSEQLIGSQAGATVNVTPAQIGTYVAGSAPLTGKYVPQAGVFYVTGTLADTVWENVTVTTSASVKTATIGSVTIPSSYIGANIVIGGAGTAGVPFKTTIAAVGSAGAVTLTDQPATAVSGAEWVAYGHDDAPAIQAALNAGYTEVDLPVPPSGLNYGQYSQINLPQANRVRFFGHGVTMVALAPITNQLYQAGNGAYDFHAADGSEVSGFRLDGLGQVAHNIDTAGFEWNFTNLVLRNATTSNLEFDAAGGQNNHFHHSYIFNDATVTPTFPAYLIDVEYQDNQVDHVEARGAATYGVNDSGAGTFLDSVHVYNAPICFYLNNSIGLDEHIKCDTPATGQPGIEITGSYYTVTGWMVYLPSDLGQLGVQITAAGNHNVVSNGTFKGGTSTNAYADAGTSDVQVNNGRGINFFTSGGSSLGSAGLLTVVGITSNGNLLLNNNAAAATTNIGTGTTTGNVNIGGSSDAVALKGATNTAPTRSANDNSTNVSNTAYADGAARAMGSNLALLTSASASWTVPANVSMVKVCLVGGGGGGGAVPNATASASGGLGGEAGCFDYAVTPGGSVAYTNDTTGGAGGAAGNNNGTTGGNVTFGTITLYGGTGGVGSGSGNAAAPAVPTRHSFIPTTSLAPSWTAWPISLAGVAGAGGAGGGCTAQAAGLCWGAVGATSGANSAGNNATGYGLGGGGASSTSGGAFAGGNGSPSAIMVRY